MPSNVREINLELGRPYVEEAIKRLIFELKRSASMKDVTVVKIIHGYGSSGTGGKIRTATRKYLTECQARGDIRSFITGEKFSIFDEDTRKAFLRCDELRRDRDLERHNNGVSFVVL